VILFSAVEAAHEEKISTRRKRIAAFVGLVTAVFVFVLYVLTLAPTVLYYDRPILLDSTMLQTQAAVLGMTGPTGEPSWVMLTHLFTYLPFGDVAYRVNLASAVYAAVAVGLVFWAGWLLSRRVVAAATGALAFGLGATFWSQAVIAEIYTFNGVMIMAPIIVLLLWRERRQDRYLLLASFLMGFALTNHLTSGLVLPTAFLFVAAVDWRKLLDWRLVLKGVGLFLLGLTPYLYLPIRGAMDPPMNEANPTTPGRFLEFVSGSDLHGVFGQYGPAELLGRLAFYWDFLLANFHWGLLMIAVVGFIAMAVRDRAAVVLIGVPYLGWLFHALEFGIFDTEIYFITTYMMLALALAVGMGFLLRSIESLVADLDAVPKIGGIALISLALLSLPLLAIPQTFAENDMSEDYTGRDILNAVKEKTEPNSTVLHHRSNLWYMVLVEKERRDLTIIDPWFPSWKRDTDIVWPDDIDAVTTDLRYGTHDYTGVSTAREAAKNGPVYILDQESAGPGYFREAGFKIVRVEEDVLYELVPPGKEPYTKRGKVVSVKTGG
jgi:hypothetical protein